MPPNNDVFHAADANNGSSKPSGRDQRWVDVKNEVFVSPKHDQSASPTGVAHMISALTTPTKKTTAGGSKQTSGLRRGHTVPSISSSGIHRNDSNKSKRLRDIEEALQGLAIERRQPIGSKSATTSTTAPPLTQKSHSEPVLPVIEISSDEEEATDVDEPVAPRIPTGQAPSASSSFSSTNSRFVPVNSNPSFQRDKGKQKASAAGPSVSRGSPLVQVPASVLKFSVTPFGTELNLVIIGHCAQTQALFDEQHVAWGVQYECSRGVTTGSWSWEAVRENINALRGTNEEAAPKVERVMGQKSTYRPSDEKIWKHLDLEQAAIAEGLGRGLGLMGEFHGVADWFGGKVQQIARLEQDGASFKVKLDRMESRRSHRFARFYGSRRFLQLRIPEDLLKKRNADVKRYLCQKFVICGRIFVPFHTKEKKTYLVETNDESIRKGLRWCADDKRLPFSQFVNWHNPLDKPKNFQQVITKYTARFALGLSNSTPVVEFEEKDIHFVDDLTAEDWPHGSKGAPADKLMTDGCGFLNQAALIRIAKTMDYSSLPAGVQGRIDGSKGFFILHPTDTSDVPKVWIRDSQHKIQNRSFDRAHRIFDLLCASQSMPSTALTSQMIINLFSNGIPEDMLVELMERGLEADVAPLLEWDKPNAMVFLYHAIAQLGRINVSRAQRVSYSLNRVLGLTGRDWSDNDGIQDDDEEEMGDTDEDASMFRSRHSKMPYMLHEVALELIQAGFQPRENQLLKEKIKYMVETTIKSSVERYRLPIVESVGAYIVPDPLGILEEGEVSFRFSKPRKDPETEMLMYKLKGDILIGRYPIRLPSDIQRVKAVDRPELEKWPDVLIVSTKGKRSIASLLADGGKSLWFDHMDGDETVLLWGRLLVEHFRNQEFTSPPDNFIRDNFDKDVESVEQFCTRIAGLQPHSAHEAFQEVLIANLSESHVGLYSRMHENATIRYGYNSPEAIRLAYIFATLLDSSKNGCRLKKGLFRDDDRKYGNYAKHTAPSTTAVSDILRTLGDKGQRKGEELIARYHAQAVPKRNEPYSSTEVKPDPLREPFDRAANLAHGIPVLTKELSLILARINDVLEIKTRIGKNYAAEKEKTRAGLQTPSKRKVKGSQTVKRDDYWLPCAERFGAPLEEVQLLPNVREVMASYLYTKEPTLAFNIAFNELCKIKASSMPGGIAPTTRIFDEARVISPVFLRALASLEDRLLETQL